MTSGDRVLTVSWLSPGNDGGAEITGYDLRYIRSDASDKADENWMVEEGIWNSGVLRYELSGLTNGVDYDLQLRAVNIAGDGEWSGSTSGAPQTRPAAPTINSMDSGLGSRLRMTFSDASLEMPEANAQRDMTVRRTMCLRRTLMSNSRP